MSKAYTDPELRGQITSRQHDVEEIMLRCVDSGFPEAAEELAIASGALTRAKLQIRQKLAEKGGEG